MKKINKKTFILPLMIVAGIVVSSVLATGTNVMAQSIYRDRASIEAKNQELTEEIEQSQSLTSLSPEVSNLGFVTATRVDVNSGPVAMTLR